MMRRAISAAAVPSAGIHHYNGSGRRGDENLLWMWSNGIGKVTGSRTFSTTT
ncbi:MAG TPA: hypothetical protein VHZ55_16740 [Bryobacteraceae bacterium]|nr:hypothetical protein [Bryobacteraceae bacterium]